MARSSAVMSRQVGIIQISEPSQSVMDKIQSTFLSKGNGLMKLIATLSPWVSGMGRGCKGPVGLCVEDLLCRHLVQDGM